MSVRDFLKAVATLVGVGATSFSTHLQALSDTHGISLDLPGGVIDISFAAGGLDLSPSQIVEWVSKAARAVVTYYGVFPVPRMHVRVESAEGRSGVFHGTTWGSTPPLTRIYVGRHTTQAQLDEDWMMTHELVHTAFPDVADEHHWIEEGIATYVEPIARAQAGDLSVRKVWADMVRGMPQGQPQAGDAGLDHTHTWGRTYWGGALFCLSADVQIRLASQNRVGLQNALRAIQHEGGTIEVDWPLERALGIGDKETQTVILSTLYREMKDKPVTIDLPSMWRNLGVKVASGSEATFDDGAPWAATRMAINGTLRTISHSPQKIVPMTITS